MKATLLFITLPLLIATGCRKPKQEKKAYTPKYINAFTLYTEDNPSLILDVKGVIAGDSIVVGVPKTTRVESLIPTVDFKGASLSPASKKPEDFTRPVVYTVTADDGTASRYRIIVHKLDNTKDMISFVFRKADNPSLDQDIEGEIIGDSIAAPLPATATFESLIPSITYTGQTIDPVDRQARDFRSPAVYAVIAEDGSAHHYTVHTGYRTDVFAVGNDGHLYDIDAMTGIVRWRYYTGGSGTPVYDNGVVYVLGFHNAVYAIDVKTGTLKWKSTPPAGRFSLGLPVAKYGKIYFGGSGTLPFDGRYVRFEVFIYCIDAATGATSWLQKMSPGYAGKNEAHLTNVTVEDNIACIYDILTGFFAVSATDGTPLWASSGGDMLGRANPAISNGRVYYGVEGGSTCMSASDWQRIWRKVDWTGSSSVTISNNTVFTGFNDQLAALTPDGNLKWKTSYDKSRYTAFHPPSVFENMLIGVTLNNNILAAFNSTDGTLLWDREKFLPNQVIINNTIYIPDMENRINCLDANGVTRWTTTPSVKFLYPFCVVDHRGNTAHATESGAQQ